MVEENIVKIDGNCNKYKIPRIMVKYKRLDPSQTSSMPNKSARVQSFGTENEKKSVGAKREYMKMVGSSSFIDNFVDGGLAIARTGDDVFVIERYVATQY